MCMRSRISIIATVLSLIFAICLWNIIEMGGLYIFDNYYIVHNGREYSSLYRKHDLINEFWELPKSEAPHKIRVYYGFKELPMLKTHTAWGFDDERLKMFILDKDYTLCGDVDFSWPTIESSKIEAFVIGGHIDGQPGGERIISTSEDIEILKENCLQSEQKSVWQTPEKDFLKSWTVKIRFEDFYANYLFGIIGILPSGEFCFAENWRHEDNGSESKYDNVFVLDSSAQELLSGIL